MTSKQLKIKIKSSHLLLQIPEGSLPTGGGTGTKDLTETELSLKQRLETGDGGELFAGCVPDDSTWSVERTKEGLSILTITLAKGQTSLNWPSLLRE